MRRRSLITVAAGLAVPALAHAQTGSAGGWAPDRPVRLVVPFTAGSTTDTTARMIAAQLGRGLGGATVVVENRAGAGGTVGALHVAQQPPDGTALLLGAISTHAVNPHLVRDLRYDPFRDFTPILAYCRARAVLAVRPQLGPRSMQEFVALARTRSLSIASPGTGTTGHLGHAQLALTTGVQTVHVPYRDSVRAVPDLLGGQVDAIFFPVPVVRPHVEAGTMLGLGITGEGRSGLLPQVPSMAEVGLPRVDVVGWWAVYGPARLSAPIVERVGGVLDAALREPETLAALARNGLEPMGGDGAALLALQRREYDRWGEVVRQTGMTAEG
jgi:tripartite-type tricarboxylate transporter receptor subunit TctC